MSDRCKVSDFLSQTVIDKLCNKSCMGVKKAFNVYENVKSFKGSASFVYMTVGANCRIFSLNRVNGMY